MNIRVAFDTHAFVKRLEAAGMSVPHAEALADALGDIVLQSITTKSDLREVDLGLRAEIKELRAEMKELAVTLRAEMKELAVTLRAEMKELELRLMIRMGTMLAASTALTVAILGTLITLS